MKIKKAVLFVSLIGAGVLGSSCCSKSYQPGFVYRDWASRMSEMGIFPVYPPREDIVVGDVYAVPMHPYDSAAVGYIGGLGNAGIHIGFIGDTNLNWEALLPRFEQYYSGRPYAADTFDRGAGGTNALPMTPIDSFTNAFTPAQTSAFAKGSTARMRQVAFPDFSVTTISQSSLSAVVPIEAIMSSLNFNYNDIRAVHFKIPQAESYGLTTEELLKDVYCSDLIRYSADGSIYLDGTAYGVISVGGAQMAFAMFKDILNTLLADPTRKLPEDIRQHIIETGHSMSNQIYVALISEVFCARAMDITIDRKTAKSAAASARPITADELKKLKDLGLTAAAKSSSSTNAAAGGTNTLSAPNAELIEISEGDNAFELARKMRELEQPQGLDAIGGSVKVMRVSASNIGLRRIFQRPIVVGVRGVLLKVDVNTPYYTALGRNVVTNMCSGEPEFTNAGPRLWLKVESFGKKPVPMPSGN